MSGFEPGAIPAEALATAQAHFDDGRPLTALAGLQAYGAPRDWTGLRAKILAARLTGLLGGDRTGLAMQMRLLRNHPGDPEAVVFGCFGLLNLRGPLAVVDRTARLLAEAPEMTPETAARVHSIRGLALGLMKDFDAAEECFAAARQCPAVLPWVLTDEARVAETADDLDRGIELCREALAIKPRYRSAADLLISWLLLKNRDDEAGAMLHDMTVNTEWSTPLWAGQVWLSGLGRSDQALRALEMYEARVPLLDAGGRKRLAAARSSLLLENGDFAGAAAWAEKADSPFHQALAERGRQPGAATARRRMLEVGFVRQNDMTCAPATLTMLALYWGLPADHLALASEICYDGTAGWKQRRWIEQQGWAVRDFTVTPESARALIDAGVPFALATAEANSGHLQAVIGYDDRTGCLIIRDPNLRHHLSFPEKDFYERQAANGPRGTAFVPAAEARRLAPIALPDAGLHDLIYSFDQALDAHRRVDAGALLARMEQEAPGHRLTLGSRMRLQLHDGNHPAALATVDELLLSHPKNARLNLLKFRISAGEMPHAARLEFVRQQAAQPGAEMIWHITLVDMLGSDARHAAEFSRGLRRLCRRLRGTGALDFQTTSAEQKRDWARVLQLRRFAACLNPRDEDRAGAWLETAMLLGRSDEVLAWLHRRWQREGKKDAGPARTLQYAIAKLHGNEAARDLMDQALALRPDDGELLLTASSLCEATGQPDRADALLQAARGKVPSEVWHQAAARRESTRGRPAEAVVHLRSVLAASPLHLPAHERLCSLLEEMEGPGAAIRQVEQARAAQPMHLALRHLHLSLLRRHSDPRALQVIQAALAADPSDAWCLRELALELGDRHQPGEALAAARRSAEIAPHHAASWTILGSVLATAGAKQEAREAFARALTLDVDVTGAAAGLIEASASREDRRATLDWLLAVIATTPTNGDAISSWGQLAFPHFHPDEHLQRLLHLRQACPHVWQAHATLVARLGEVRRPAETAAAIADFCRAFPALPGTHIVSGHALLAAGDHAGAARLAQEALKISQEATGAWTLLYDAHQAAGRPRDALAVLRTRHERAPHSPEAAFAYATAFWDSGDRWESWEIIEATVAAHPHFQSGWDWLLDHVAAAGRTSVFATRAAAIVGRHPHDTSLLSCLAAAQAACGQTGAADETLMRALSLRPADTGLQLHRVSTLRQARRIADALRACRVPGPDGVVPACLAIEEASILRDEKRSGEAIAVLEALTSRCPDEASAWLLLAELYNEKKLGIKELAAATHAARLRPGHPHPQNVIGWIHLEQEPDSSESAAHLAAAEAAFRAALALAPGHTGALHGLVETCLRARRAPDALAAVQAAGPGIDPALSALLQLRIDLRVNPGVIRPDAAATLLRSDTLENEAYFSVHNALISDPVSGKNWGAILHQTLLDGAVRHPAVAVCWALTQLHDGKKLADSLANLPLKENLRRVAWAEACDHWIEAGALQPILDGVARHPEKLRPTDDVWNRVARALNNNDQQDDLIQWTADWQTRASADVVAQALAGQARAVVISLLAAVPVWEQTIDAAADIPDHNVHLHRNDLAVAAALSGKFAKAEALLNEAPTRETDGRWLANRNFMARLARALITAGRDHNAASTTTQLRSLNSDFPQWRESPMLNTVHTQAMEAFQRFLPKAGLDKVLQLNTPKPRKAPRPRPGPGEEERSGAGDQIIGFIGIAILFLALAGARALWRSVFPSSKTTPPPASKRVQPPAPRNYSQAEVEQAKQKALLWLKQHPGTETVDIERFLPKR